MIINYNYATIKINTAIQKACTRLIKKNVFYQNAKQFHQNTYDINIPIYFLFTNYIVRLLNS